MGDTQTKISLKRGVSHKSLDEEYARAEALFSSIGTGAIATNEEGKIYRINAAALQILGYKESDLVGHWFSDVIKAVDIHGNEIDPIDRPIIRAFLNGTPVSEKMYYLTSENINIPVQVTVSPILLHGVPVGAVEVFRDISLEYEIDKMKSEFISIASHQLRTPLSAINTYANMLHSGFHGELNSEQKEFMSIILGSVDRMNGLITALLDISQLEAGRLSVNNQNFDLVKFVSEVTNEQARVAENRKLSLNLVLGELDKKPLEIDSDPLLLGEIFNNLISNALKYTPEAGEVTVRLVLKQNEAIFSVKDTGYGIPTELQPRIFTKFYRADNIRKIDTTGSGLGLYMVKHIANLLRGRIWFKSHENKGSTFYLAIPLV